MSRAPEKPIAEGELKDWRRAREYREWLEDDAVALAEYNSRVDAAHEKRGIPQSIHKARVVQAAQWRNNVDPCGYVAISEKEKARRKKRNAKRRKSSR